MALLWLSIRVDLVDGAPAPALWPRPGRVLVAGPDMTFRMLADAIELAFGRWGRPRPHVFTLSDGTRIERDDADGTERLVRLEYGERFAYELDPGDGWSHLCTVGPAPVDPLTLLGPPPTTPVVVDGWGLLPDQNGREWESDDGVTPVAPRPSPPLSDLPDLLPWWGSGAHWLAAPSGTDPDDAAAEGALGPFGDEDAAPWDEPWDEVGLARLRTAMEADDPIAIAALCTEHDATDVVHLVGPTLARAAATGDPNAREALRPLLIVLDERDWPSDQELADEFQFALDLGAPSLPETPTTAERTRFALTPTPVDLATLAAVLDGPMGMTVTWRLEVGPGRLIPPSVPGGAPTLEGAAEPTADSIPVAGLGSRNHFDDLLEFIALGPHPGTAGVIASAPRAIWTRIEEDLLRDPEQYHQWTLFAQERRLGRARRWLTERGLRPLAPWESSAGTG